ncbi:MAG: ribosome maturation factor RimP [Candidatus Tokpelaia sp. JSC189]|nr:MAG: ribosome maturation factor RimP [Candidatus Tokpelaia sp. JSC189]
MSKLTIVPTSLDEPRLTQETGVEGRVAAVIEPVLKPSGYRLVRVRLSRLSGLTLQIMAERADGIMTIEDCELVSRTISPVLDAEDLIDRQYHLEVSSPGIDRPLVRKSDFANWQGYIVKAETSVMIGSRKKFHGHITNVDSEGFGIETNEIAYGEILVVRIPFINLTKARLVLTDKLIRDALHCGCSPNRRLLEMTRTMTNLSLK